MTRQSCAGFLIGQLGPYVWPNQLQIHEACARYSLVSPLRDRGRFHVAHSRYGSSTTEAVDFFGVGMYLFHGFILAIVKSQVNSHSYAVAA